MSSAVAMAAIPRFLLPRRGPAWQSLGAAVRPSAGWSRTADSLASVASACRRPHGCQRLASTRASPPPGRVLEKPAKFNPPSHGARLPRKGAPRHVPASQHYGGDLSAAERAAQAERQYPGMMPPQGTLAHWFWTSRLLHLGVTMTALTALAIYTFLDNFQRSSPYVDMLPTAADALRHPILAARTTLEVVRLTEQQRALEIAEKRQRRIDDVAKRTLYRKAHGLEETVGFSSGWLTGGVKKADPVPPARNEEDPALDDASPIRGAAVPIEVTADADADASKRKRFLGIF